MNPIKVILALTFFSISLLLASQNAEINETKLSREHALNIFIDCNYCDQVYFKEQFTIVNYVRDRKEADVHILITEMRTGGGGTEFSLQFIGRNKYKSLIDTVTYGLPSDYTDNEERVSLLKNIQLGLVPYILKTKFADKLTLTINSDLENIAEKDPWKNWVFRVSANGWGQVQKSYTDFNVNSAIKVQKVTADIKIESRVSSNYEESKVRLYENDSLVYSSDTYQRSYRFSNLITKSIGDHFGVGGFFNVRTSTYNNLALKVNVSPAIEYNVFSYSQASSKQLRFLYSVGYINFNYLDTTIYNKTHQDLFNHELRVMLKICIKLGICGGKYLRIKLHE